jgi:hypothetical protein
LIKANRKRVICSLGKVSLLDKVSDAIFTGCCAMAWLNGRRRMATATISNFECTKTDVSLIIFKYWFFSDFSYLYISNRKPPLCGMWLEIVRGNASSGFSLPFGFDFLAS